MTEIKVVKGLPPSMRGRYERTAPKDHLKMVKALQRRPYVWMKIRQYANSPSASRFARRVRESEAIAFRDGQYEAKTSNCIVYARYMGERV